jgi:hypothetical protein
MERFGKPLGSLANMSAPANSVKIPSSFREPVERSFTSFEDEKRLATAPLEWRSLLDAVGG